MGARRARSVEFGISYQRSRPTRRFDEVIGDQQDYANDTLRSELKAEQCPTIGVIGRLLVSLAVDAAARIEDAPTLLGLALSIVTSVRETNSSDCARLDFASKGANALARSSGHPGMASYPRTVVQCTVSLALPVLQSSVAHCGSARAHSATSSSGIVGRLRPPVHRRIVEMDEFRQILVCRWPELERAIDLSGLMLASRTTRPTSLNAQAHMASTNSARSAHAQRPDSCSTLWITGHFGPNPTFT